MRRMKFTLICDVGDDRGLNYTRNELEMLLTSLKRWDFIGNYILSEQMVTPNAKLLEAVFK